MIAKTLCGLEDVLADELSAIGAEAIKTGRRMVSFTGDKAMLYKANFCCRTALRILKPIIHFKANDADAVYREVKNIDWDKYLSLDTTFAVDTVVYSENFNHSKFVAYRTKDAIADYFSDKYEKRPSVRVNNPDIYINVHISHDDCTVSLDSSGESLHKRGYRVSQVDAPLNEALAAGMILKTGWRGESNFVDPMCGSGTLLIEAAMIALNMPPGVCRKEYAFEQWPDFDPDLLDEIYNDDSAERAFKFKCYGSDISPAAIEKAMKNVRSAGLLKYIELKTIPFQQFSDAPEQGILVTNPPYGERIAANDIFELYSMIGERLKHVFTGYNAWILSYKEECFEKIGLRPRHKIKLMNGDLECEYRCYELFEGSNKEYKKELKNKGNQRVYDRNERARGDHAGGGRGKRFRKYDGDAERRGRYEGRNVKNEGLHESPSFRNKKFAEERLVAKSRISSGGDKKPFPKSGKSSDREGEPFKKEHKSLNRQQKPYDRNSKASKNTRYDD